MSLKPRVLRRHRHFRGWPFLLTGAVACADAALAPESRTDRAPSEQASPCVVPGFEIHSTGVWKDGIPALTNPRFVRPGDAGADDLHAPDRVIGVVVRGEALALPLSIMRWHEVVNLDRPGSTIAVSYCPLTGTAIAFDRNSINGHELGVSGLLVDNNLLMYDRSQEESLWGQMLGTAVCGAATGRILKRVPVLVTSLGKWRELHPDTEVASTDTGYDRDYDVNPYLDYDRLDAPPLFVTERSRDDRRLPKERVLGIPSELTGGLAVPFLVLQQIERTALDLSVDGERITVFWDRESETAAAHYATPAWATGFEGPPGVALRFEPADGGYVDALTGSVWNFGGEAVSGPAKGSRLTPVPGALVAYWFAWAAFHPETGIVATLG